MAYPHELPDLGYDYDALEPHIDARTMEIHYSKHHQGYTNKLNAALEGAPDFYEYSAEQLLRGLDALPESIRTAVRNNGGGYYNHALFWEIMAPGGADRPSGDLGAAIDDAFGSVDALGEKLTGAAGSRAERHLRASPTRGRARRRRPPGRGGDGRRTRPPRRPPAARRRRRG